MRHGQTDFNLRRRYQGQEDVPLNDTGLAQARAVARRLALEPALRIFSSDLSRTRQTAEQIAASHNREVELSADLREAHLGVLQGQPWDDASRLLGDDAAILGRMDIRAHPPGGESPLHVRRRCQRFARQLARSTMNGAAGDIVIVAHGGSLRALLAVLLRLPAAAGWAFRFDNCSLTTVLVSETGETTLLSYNECQHLDGR